MKQGASRKWVGREVVEGAADVVASTWYHSRYRGMRSQCQHAEPPCACPHPPMRDTLCVISHMVAVAAEDIVDGLLTVYSAL